MGIPQDQGGEATLAVKRPSGAGCDVYLYLAFFVYPVKNVVHPSN